MSNRFGHVRVIRGGNIFETLCDSIVVTTNTVGVMGAGIAKQAKSEFPGLERVYQEACRRKRHTTERPLICEHESGKTIVCFATKQDWRNPSRVEWIRSGLQYIVENQHSLGGSVAIPPLGCGLGGLDYERDLRPLFIEFLPQLNIDVVLYL